MNQLNREIIYKQFDEIDEQFILEAAPKGNRRPIYLPIVSVAAALLLLIIFAPQAASYAKDLQRNMSYIFHFQNGTNGAVMTDGNFKSTIVNNDYLQTSTYITVENDQVYFKCKEKKTNITHTLDEKKVFSFTYIDQDQLKHKVFISGESDTLGWVECIYDFNGTMIASFSSLEKKPQWVETLEIEKGIKLDYWID